MGTILIFLERTCFSIISPIIFGKIKMLIFVITVITKRGIGNNKSFFKIIAQHNESAAKIAKKNLYNPPASQRSRTSGITDIRILSTVIRDSTRLAAFAVHGNKKNSVDTSKHCC